MPLLHAKSRDVTSGVAGGVSESYRKREGETDERHCTELDFTPQQSTTPTKLLDINVICPTRFCKVPRTATNVLCQMEEKVWIGLAAETCVL